MMIETVLCVASTEEVKRKRGRPSTGFDKLSYNRQFMADKRAATKLGITVKEFRAARNTPSQAK